MQDKADLANGAQPILSGFIADPARIHRTGTSTGVREKSSRAFFCAA